MPGVELPKPCGNGPCKYLGWLGLVVWCRHPAHLEPIEPARAAAIRQTAGKCASWVDFEQKVMPTMKQWWPDPVKLAGVFER